MSSSSVAYEDATLMSVGFVQEENWQRYKGSENIDKLVWDLDRLLNQTSSKPQDDYKKDKELKYQLKNALPEKASF